MSALLGLLGCSRNPAGGGGDGGGGAATPGVVSASVTVGVGGGGATGASTSVSSSSSPSSSSSTTSTGAGGSGCTAPDSPERIATTAGSMQQVAMDDDYAYWTEFHGVSRVSFCTKEVTVFATEQTGSIYTVAVDTDSVVWGTGGYMGNELRIAPVGGGTPKTIWHGGTVYAVALDGPRIFFSVGISLKEGIWSVGKDGSNPTKLYGGSSTYTVAVDDDSVYFSVEGDPGHVMKMPKTGGTPVVLGNLRADYELTTDAANVYAAAGQGGMHDANVVVFPKDGGSHSVLASGHTAGGVALLGDRVAWTTYDDDSAPDGRLLIAPIAGGPITTIGSGYQHPGYIVSHNGVLVWAEYWGQAVWRMHVP